MGFMKDRAIQVSLTKPVGEITTKQAREIDKDALLYWNAFLIANARHASVGFVAVYAAVKTIDTISQVAIIKAARV